LHIADVFNHRIRKYITSTDSTPYFTFSGVPTLYLCLTEGFLTTPIDTYLTAYDANVSQTLTWNALMSPSNGILSGTYSTLSTGAAVTPSGFTYTPTLGYIGTDSFSYTINDGIGYDTIKLYAFMNTTPTAGIISGDDSVCVGDTAHLSSTIAGGVWSTLNPSISTISTSGILTGVASGVDTVVYTVTNHCGTDTSYFPVVIIDGQLCNSSLNGSHNSLSFKVFPNPNNGQFNIQFPNHTSKDILVTVRNMYGQVVGTVNVKDAKQTSVKMDIPAGIYSVEAVTANSKYTQMLIVR
jgi:hypothetical protein